MPRTSTARPKTKAQRANVGRLAITLFALLAFTFQSFIAQIHVHTAPWAASSMLDAGKAAQPGKLPASDDQSNCPICQAVLHGGQFITPSAVTFALPSFVVFFVATGAQKVPVIQAGSHNWQSRAPPRI